MALITLESVEITTYPTAASCAVGGTLDYTGLEVTAYYSNGTTADVTDNCVLSPAEGATAAQMKPNPRYASTYELDVYQDASMVKVGKKWAQQSIKVRGGGQKPDIVTLTKAFNSVWKVDVVSEVLQLAKNPKLRLLKIQS